MRMVKSITTMILALAAVVGYAADSAPFMLDTMEGTRVAREVEEIAYSTAWENGTSVRVALDGTTLKEATAPASGDVIWNAANADWGTHTLTHTTYTNGVAGKVESVTFRVKGIFTVTFDTNGGSLDAASSTRSVAEDEPVGKLPTPTRTGHTFAGWWTAASGGTQVSASSVPTSDATYDITYYAHWIVNQYTVTFNPNGGSVAETSREVESGAAVGELPVPARTHFAFDGWFTAAADGTQVTSETVVRSSVTYYAHWTEVKTPVITPADGATFRTGTCTVTITCETPGAVIYYSSNGRTPTATARYLYSGPFTISDTATVTAFAVKGDGQSDYADATITHVDSGPLTLKDALDEPKLGEVATGGEAEWIPVEDATAKVGGSCAMSGEVPDDDDAVHTVWMRTVVRGKGTFAFWWRVDCEPDPRGRFTYDYGSVTIDGNVVERKDGTTEWRYYYTTFTTEGEHEIVWTYVSDGYPAAYGEYAGRMWVDGVSWSGADMNGVTVDAGGGKTVTVPAAWLAEKTSRAATDTAANGLKVWECYVLGLDPESADSDFRITSLPMKADGTPDLENLTFAPAQSEWNVVGAWPVLKGAATLGDGNWQTVTEENKAQFRFFKVVVELP